MEELLEEVRSALRVKTTLTDAEVRTFIATAIEDMRRVGIRDELLDTKTMSSLAKSAVIMYCKAHYGFDNSQAGQFHSWYLETVTCLKNSTANEVLYEAMSE